MPNDLTTTEAAAYLAEHGYTVHSKKAGTDKPPASELIKRWCESGKLKARKTNWIWLISKRELDRLIETNVASNVADTPSGERTTAPESQETH
jgi:hypothetical protein